MTSGGSVPDWLVISMLVRELQDAGSICWTVSPRTIAQAEALEEVLDRAGRALTATVLIDVPTTWWRSASRDARPARRPDPGR